jgi:hypothetical protein
MVTSLMQLLQLDYEIFEIFQEILQKNILIYPLKVTASIFWMMNEFKHV